MHDDCIPTPNEEKWLNIAEGYQQRAQFSHCIGAIDGNHVEVRLNTLTINTFFSVVLIAVVDFKLLFHVY